MSAGRLEVEVVTKLDQLEQGLKKAEARVQKTGKTMDNALGSPGGKLAVNMGKVFAVMGVAEGAIKGLGGAMHAVSGLGKLMEGDAKGFQESMAASAELLKSMPFGIGALVAGFEQVASSLMGITEIQEKLARMTAELAASRAARDTELTIAAETKLLEKQYELMIETDVEHATHLQHQLELESNRIKMNQKMNTLRRQAQAAREAGDAQTALNLKHAADALKDQFIVQEMIINAKKKQLEHDALLAKQAEEQKRLDKEREESEKRIAEEKKKAIEEEKKLLALDKERQSAIDKRLGVVAAGEPSKDGLMEQGGTAMGSFTFGEQGAQETIKKLTEESKNLQQDMATRMQAIENLVRSMSQNLGFA
jgi:hypothetical protein